MVIVKCPKCGNSTHQPDGNGWLICPYCKTKITYEDTFATFIGEIFIGLIILLFILAACIG
jgi:uncharacterized OB-fold protein